MMGDWRAPVRRPFLYALAASLLLHLSALFSPGWHLPWLERPDTALPLAATLVIPAHPEPAPAPRPVPQAKPKPKPAPARPASTEAPRVETPSPEQTSSPPAPPAPPVAAPEEAPPVAVPPAPTFAGTWPRHGRIRFTVTRGEGGLIVGEALHEWWHDETAYLLRATTETTGLAALFKPVKVVQESRGTFVPGGLQPLEFKNERDGKLKQSLRFDPSQKRVFASNGGSYEIAGQTHDLLSIFFQLGALPADAGGTVLNVGTGRKVERYEIIALETVTLDTPFGPRVAQHLRLPGTQGGADDGEFTEVWLDTVTRLPLRIRHRDRKGEIFDQTATAVAVDNEP